MKRTDLSPIPIPITVLTGFLGSGKTTVLDYLGRTGALSRTLVLVNEFGEVGLDHELLVPIDDDTLVAVNSGCICCTIRTDLVQTLSEAPWRYARSGKRWFDKVIIETTGIADPAPILQTIIGDEQVASQYMLAGVLTTVDAVNGIATLDHHIEAVKQVAVADRILLTKTDLLDDSAHSLETAIRQYAPAAPISAVIDGQAQADWIFGFQAYGLENKSSDVEAWLAGDFKTQVSDAVNAHGHGEHDRSRHGGVQASSLVFDDPVDAALFESCLTMLMQFRGQDLLRVKGIIHVAGLDRPMVIHGVQHVFHPPQLLESWPGDDRRTRLVVIAQDLDHAELLGCFSALGLQARVIE
jgi:G3E family GTPase